MPEQSSDAVKSPRPGPLPEYRARGKSLATGVLISVALVISYATLMTFGYLGFRHQGTTIAGNEMSQDRAFFAAVNATTLTGFQTHANLNDYAPQGRIIVELLT